MEVINCKGCGKLYNDLGGRKGRLCPQCRRKLEEKFTQVKEFLREYPNASIEIVGLAALLVITLVSPIPGDEALAASLLLVP